MMPKVSVRKPFDWWVFKNPYVWAGGLDLLDFATGWIPIVGEAMDIVQLAIALAVYDNPGIGIIGAGADFLLPAQFDVIPTFVIRVYAAEKGVI